MQKTVRRRNCRKHEELRETATMGTVGRCTKNGRRISHTNALR
jgi:hypothetical protein